MLLIDLLYNNQKRPQHNSEWRIFSRNSKSDQMLEVCKNAFPKYGKSEREWREHIKERIGHFIDSIVHGADKRTFFITVLDT